MKSIYSFSIRAILLISLLFNAYNKVQAQAQQNTRAQKKQQKLDAVKKMVNNQNYIFMAERANPLGWGTINLNYNYNVVVSKDSVDSYLPYFGRAYVAPINPVDPKETGIQFKSKNFDYNSVLSKRSGWEVIIVPHDVKETRKFILDISEAGYATLSVTSENRQSISFDGYITENVPKKKKAS
ncbi:DUF4251 domain-containing protein [Mucilaginibacter arboris]|uniref:DUF4251 domain-containing protein n=1 Tax=Mucilaginibacter arboris TaxID=2682090 RepID=A0A7K1SY75_9SPHI|nr:DUF4251 domain-containing protein [Mucilaginibacter arboris]MVN22271.1 DUF4251 domain-containing protein [Mucilaginibacter arboris]